MTVYDLKPEWRAELERLGVEGVRLELFHRQRIAFQQPTDHLGGCHGLSLGTPVGDGLLRKRLDPSLDPAELCCLPQGVAGPLSSANVYRPVKSLVKTTVIGHAAMISAGEFVQMSGAWVNDRTHGQQFRASFLKSSPPTTLEGIERYLASGMIHGIGPVYAKRLVRGFGEAVFDLIEQQPERLREVSGIGAKRAARIIAGWAEQKVIREIMLFLHANGVGTSRAVRIYKTYGNDAVRVISENPYRLARDIRGDRVPHRRSDRSQGGDREDGAGPDPRRHQLRAG